MIDAGVIALTESRTDAIVNGERPVDEEWQCRTMAGHFGLLSR